MTGTVKDRELELVFGNQRAVVAALGASLRGYTVGARDVLWSYSGAENKKGGQGDVLIPFPSRVRGGKYRFEGREHQLELNDKEGPNAIHGFLRGVEWGYQRASAAEVVFTTELHARDYASRGYPFSIRAKITYRLDEQGLRCEFSLRNFGGGPAPVGIGFHPYFVVGGAIDDAEVSIPAADYFEFENLLPTGRLLTVAGTELDFRKLRRVGRSRFNQCFTHLERGADGFARAVMRDAAGTRVITVWLDEAFEYLVVYSGDAIPAPDIRRAFAIEPLTCATDAFNHPEWGLKVLQPGAEFSGRFGVNASFT